MGGPCDDENKLKECEKTCKKEGYKCDNVTKEGEEECGCVKVEDDTKRKYKVMYKRFIKEQTGGDDIFNSNDGLKWTNEESKNTYDKLLKKIGKPSKICTGPNEITEYVVWQNPYDNVEEGFYGGLDFLKLTNYHARKWHPKPADVFIIAGKYMKVPDILLGPIKYASETINVEQLFVEKNSNEEFGKSGEKGKVLVTGSCASIDISTLTVAFVEDMTKKNIETVDLALHESFREEYDNRINKYIKTKEISPISWYKRDYFY